MNSRRALERVSENLEDSLGVRQADRYPSLSPVPKSKDVGRKPLRDFGEIDINLVIPDPDQPRVAFDEESIHKLSQNIRAKGQLNPVRVRWCQQQEKWIIVAGERRWRAVREAGLPTIQCYFHENELTQPEILEESLTENLHRQDLTPIEEAKAFSSLMQINNWTGRQVAEAVGVHPAKVSRALSLLKLPEELQQQVQNREIPARSAYEISKLENDAQQRHLAIEAKAGKLTHDQTTRQVRQRRGKKCKVSRGTKLTFFDDDWRVTVSNPRKCTYHEVEAALTQALREVQHRIKNRVRLN